MRPLLLHRQPSRITLGDLARVVGRELHPVEEREAEADERAGDVTADDPGTDAELLARLAAGDEEDGGEAVADGRPVGR